jgi:hypothetical protein
MTVHHSVELKFKTNLMHNFYLFNNNIISRSSTCFEHHMLVFRRTLYICSVRYPHALYGSIQSVRIPNTAKIQCPPEDEHLMLETCRESWYYYWINKDCALSWFVNFNSRQSTVASVFLPFNGTSFDIL